MTSVRLQSTFETNVHMEPIPLKANIYIQCLHKSLKVHLHRRIFILVTANTITVSDPHNVTQQYRLKKHSKFTVWLPLYPLLDI